MDVWVYYMKFTHHWKLQKNIDEIFGFAVDDLFDVQGYEVMDWEIMGS